MSLKMAMKYLIYVRQSQTSKWTNWTKISGKSFIGQVRKQDFPEPFLMVDGFRSSLLSPIGPPIISFDVPSNMKIKPIRYTTWTTITDYFKGE